VLSRIDDIVGVLEALTTGLDRAQVVATDAHPPLVDETIFAAAQRPRDGRGTSRPDAPATAPTTTAPV
jgi:hypothetical protein